MKNQIKIRPSQELLENWKVWMAIEIVSQLKKTQSSSLGLEVIDPLFKIDDKSIFGNFEESITILKEKYLNLQKECSDSNQISKLRLELENYYFDKIVYRLQEIAQNIILRESDALKAVIFEIAKQTAPENMLMLLRKTSNYYLEQKNRYERAKIQYERDGVTALHEHESLLGKKITRDMETIKRTLFEIYLCTLKSERSRILSHLFANCIQICQTYAACSEGSLTLLNSIESELQSQCKLKEISVPIFSNLGLNIERHKELLEIWIGGHPVAYWSNAPVSWQQIKKQLLENLTPDAAEFFKSFNKCYIEHLHTVDSNGVMDEDTEL